MHSNLLAKAVYPYLNEKDLTEIAYKLHDADIDGNSFVEAIENPKILVGSVGLSVGKAINFHKGYIALRDSGSISLGATGRTDSQIGFGSNSNNDSADETA